MTSSNIFMTLSELCVSVERCGVNVNPCLNGGTCIVENKEFKCDCPIGYNGTICDSCMYFLLVTPLLVPLHLISNTSTIPNH